MKLVEKFIIKNINQNNKPNPKQNTGRQENANTIENKPRVLLINKNKKIIVKNSI